MGNQIEEALKKMSVTDDATTIFIDATLDLPAATELRASLLEGLGQAQAQPWLVEVTGPAPTAPALQLAASLHKTLLEAGASSGLGPNARALLEI